MDNNEIALALRCVNAVCAHCGLKPLAEMPKGVPPDGAKEIGQVCPLARSLPHTVIAAEYARTADRRMAEALSLSFGVPLQTFVEFPGEFVFDLPEALMSFVAHYDDHQLPQFIEQS